MEIVLFPPLTFELIKTGIIKAKRTQDSDGVQERGAALKGIATAFLFRCYLEVGFSTGEGYFLTFPV